MENEDDRNDFEDASGRLESCIAEHIGWSWFDWRRHGENFDEGYKPVPVNWAIGSTRKLRFQNRTSEIADPRK